jgi:nucleotide-binding universal stress UspA family protein
MVEYERILLPVAGNGDVDPVVDHAKTLAGALDAELIALHVVDPEGEAATSDDAGTTNGEGAAPETTAPGTGTTVTDPRDPDAVFDAVAERLDDAVPLERVVAEGDPANAIVEQVREQNCDFVVMGTHNRQGLDRLVTGSVADHVGQSAGVPVTTIGIDSA